VLPAALQLDGTLQQLTEEPQPAQDNGDFNRWANHQRELLVNNQPATDPYNNVFVQQQIGEIDHILVGGAQILRAAGNAKRVAVRKIVIPPGASHTIFLLLDQPDRVEDPAHRVFNVDLMQLDHSSGAVLGGLSSRIELAWPSIYHPA
jgi:hypothetical protein